MKPNYYAITPASVRYCKDLKPNEKLLYGEITALTNKSGYCWATNGYFAELYDVHKNTITVWLRNLEKHGFIKMVYKKEEQNKSKRIIYISDNPAESSRGINDFIDTSINEKIETGINDFIETGINEKIDHNNTSINTTRNNNTRENNISKADALNGEFEKWWEIYGKKGNRKPALQKFKTCRKKHSLDQIINGTKEYLKTVSDKKFQKHGSTFLNAEAYMDDYTQDSNYNIGASNEVSSMEKDLGLKIEPTREFTQEEIEEFNREELPF